MSRDRRDERRLQGLPAALTWSLAVLAVAGTAGAYLVLGIAADTGPLGALLFILIVASLGGVGALVATRRPRNPVGWLLWVSALSYAFLMATDELGRAGSLARETSGPMGVALAWLASLMFMPTTVVIVVVVPLFFPDGRLLSPRWRWVVALAVAGIVVLALPPAFTPGPIVNTDIDNPFAIPGFEGLLEVLGLANVLIALLAFPLTVVSCVLRYRRGDDTIRHQLKWFAAAVAWTVAWFIIAAIGGPLAGAGWILGLIGLVLLPLAIGVAILRYRLYDIDRIISRTLAWAILTGLLLGAFVALVVGLQALLRPVTDESTLAVAVSTLAAAALFQPLRARVQRAVDRRFNRARFDADRVSAAFGARLRDEVELAAVSGDLLATVGQALQPGTAGLWLRGGARRKP